MMFSNSYILPGNRWKGLGMSIPAWGKKGFIPGGRIPGDVRKGRPAAARPKGLPKFNAAAAAAEDVGVREYGSVTTGEVGRETVKMREGERERERGRHSRGRERGMHVH